MRLRRIGRALSGALMLASGVALHPDVQPVLEAAIGAQYGPAGLAVASVVLAHFAGRRAQRETDANRQGNVALR